MFIHSPSDEVFQAALLAQLEVEFEHRYTDKEKDFVQVLAFWRGGQLYWFAFR